MSCTDIQGISGISCTKSIGGIKNVWIFPFDAISEYIYTNDYLHKITGYSSTIVPVLYTPNPKTSEYKGSNTIANIKTWQHELMLTFSKMEAEKREELIKLESMDLTIIFQDRNNISWIMGQDFPVRLTNTNAMTGVKGGDNSYAFTFTSTEINHIREIEAPSDSCFVSFKGVEYRTSNFVITDASTLTWQNFSIAADTNVLTYTSPFVLDYVNWNTADKNQIAILINQYGTPVVPDVSLHLSYDLPSDTVYMTIQSPDTSYGAFLVDNTAFNSTIGVYLNLITTVSPLIANPSTIIRLEDSTGVIYEEPYNTAISDPNFAGTIQDLFINVSAEYLTGTTFYLSIVDLPCATAEYEYVWENTLTACSLLVDWEFYKGQDVYINLPTIYGIVDAPRFQNMTFSIFGNVYRLYHDYTLWHSDYTQLQNDIINILNSCPVTIDSSSLVFTDNTNDIQIRFKSIVTNDEVHPYYSTFVYGLGSPSPNNSPYTFSQSRVLNLTTSAPYPAVLTHTDEFAREITGEVYTNILTNDFELSNTPVSNNTSVDNVGLLWAFDGTQGYWELSTLTTSVDAETCLAPSIEYGFNECYTGFTSETETYMAVMTLADGNSTLGSQFQLVTPFQNLTLWTAGTVNPNQNLHKLCERISSVKGLQVLHADYDNLDKAWRIYVRVDNATSITNFVAYPLRAFTISSFPNIFTNEFISKTNPYTQFEWSLNTTAPSSLIGTSNLTIGHWQDIPTLKDAIQVIWNQAGDQLTVAQVYAAVATMTYDVSFHEDYPTATNSFLDITLGAGVPFTVQGGVAALLITNGSNVADIKYVAYTNQVGWRYILPIDLTLASDSVTFQERTSEPQSWGTLDHIEYVGSTQVTPPTVSTIYTCACCDDLTAPDATNTVVTYTYSGIPDVWTTELTFTDEVLCNIFYMEIELIPDLGSPTIDTGSPIVFNTNGCQLGYQAFYGNDVAFTGDPTGASYIQQITTYDITHTLINTYTKPVTF